MNTTSTSLRSQPAAAAFQVIALEPHLGHFWSERIRINIGKENRTGKSLTETRCHITKWKVTINHLLLKTNHQLVYTVELSVWAIPFTLHEVTGSFVCTKILTGAAPTRMSESEDLGNVKNNLSVVRVYYVKEEYSQTKSWKKGTCLCCHVGTRLNSESCASQLSFGWTSRTQMMIGTDTRGLMQRKVQRAAEWDLMTWIQGDRPSRVWNKCTNLISYASTRWIRLSRPFRY